MRNSAYYQVGIFTRLCLSAGQNEGGLFGKAAIAQGIGILVEMEQIWLIFAGKNKLCS
jgi:hypothetical protein